MSFVPESPDGQDKKVTTPAPAPSLLWVSHEVQHGAQKSPELTSSLQGLLDSGRC